MTQQKDCEENIKTEPLADLPFDRRGSGSCQSRNGSNRYVQADLQRSDHW